MADKQITVAVPEERVPDFYLWFAHFLAGDGGPRGRGRGRGRERGFGPGGPEGPDGPRGPGPGGFGPEGFGPGFGPGPGYGPGPGFGPEGFGPEGEPGRRGPGRRGMHPVTEWGEQDAEKARWLIGRLAPPARALFDLLLQEPGKPWAGTEIAERLELDKGAHGIAGVLAWPGRYCRKLGRPLPIVTSTLEDGGTAFAIPPQTAALFADAPATDATPPEGEG